MLELFLFLLLFIGAGSGDSPLVYASMQQAPDRCTQYDLVKVDISVTINEGRELNTIQPTIVKTTCREDWKIFNSNAYYKNKKYEIFCFNGDFAEATVLRTPLDDWIVFKKGKLVGCII